MSPRRPNRESARHEVIESVGLEWIPFNALRCPEGCLKRTEACGKLNTKLDNSLPLSWVFVMMMVAVQLLTRMSTLPKREPSALLVAVVRNNIIPLTRDFPSLGRITMRPLWSTRRPPRTPCSSAK